MLNFDLNEYLNELEKLVNIDSGSRVPGGPDQIADYFEGKYTLLGLQVRRIRTDGANGPILEIRNRPETPRMDVLLMGHMDTVFPEGEAEHRSFRMENGTAYGPGVADMKAGLLSTYYLVKNLVEQQADLSFGVCLNSDEEISSLHSQDRIQELAAISDVCVVMEPGRKNGAYVSERKGLARFHFEVHGVSAHAGIAPQDGASAINELAYITLQMEALNHYEIGTSVNVGKISGGTSANVLCDYAEAMVDVRFDSMEEYYKIESAFQNFVAHPRDPRTTVRIKREGYRPPMRRNERTEAVIRLMNEKGAKHGVEMKWVKTGGGSDGNFAAFAGSAVVDGVGPVGDGAHSKNETMQIATVEPRLKVIFETVLALAEQGKKGR